MCTKIFNSANKFTSFVEKPLGIFPILSSFILQGTAKNLGKLKNINQSNKHMYSTYYI